MKVIPVENRKDFNKFIFAPDFIHVDDPHFISPLKISVKRTLNIHKNPLWKVSKRAMFICTDDHKILGRIAAIYHPWNLRNQEDNVGYFGYFDCINDQQIAKLLIDKAVEYLQTFHCSSILGPMNPNINYEMGILTEGYNHKPFFMMNYNPPYYADLLLSLGYTPAMHFYAYRYKPGINDTKIERIARKVQLRYDVKIKNIDFSNFKREANDMYRIYNEAFAAHYAYVPFSKQEFLFVAQEMKVLMNKKLLFKVYCNDELAGFMLTLPNYNEVISRLAQGRLNLSGIIKFLQYRSKIKSAKVMVAAILPKFQHCGLGSIMYSEIKKRTDAVGMSSGELSWVAENNSAMVNLIKSTGFEIEKKYALFEKDII